MKPTNKSCKTYELCTYVGSKETASGYGLLLIDMENDLSLLFVGIGQPE
jgi:hypothetical protein